MCSEKANERNNESGEVAEKILKPPTEEQNRTEIKRRQ